jgi:phosphonate transport system ATP-binding protein
LVELNKVSAGYDGRAVLHDLDLSIRAGERLAVMGRSGAGKTTLLNLLFERLCDRVALIPQAAALVRTLSVFHNVYMGRLDRRATWYNLRNLVWPARGDNGRPIVIGDEPVSALDRVQAADLLGKLCSRHGTAIFALHDIPLALAHADRIVVIESGRIVLDAPARALTAVDLVPYYGG